MKKIIEIDITNKSDLLEKYNQKIVAKELIYYLITESSKIEKNDTIKIIIHTQIKEQLDCISLIKEGLQLEYNQNIRKFHHNNLKQITFLIAGIIALFTSTLIDITILKEIILIGGWVLIWEMVESEIFEDMNNRKKKRIIQKLLNSEMTENKIMNNEE